jgi:hypothetical protein
MLTIHHAKYYNVKHKKYMWINGSDHPRLEPVLCETSVIALGIDGGRQPDFMRQKLESHEFLD